MDTTAIIAGSAFTFLGFFPVPLCIRIIWVLLTDVDCRKNQCYFLMAQVEIFDLIVCLGEGVFGITVATTHRLFGFTEYVAVPMAAAAWMIMLSTNLVLATNRLRVVCRLSISNSVVRTLMAISFLFGLFFLVSYASRFSPLLIEDGLTFFYDMSLPYAQLVEKCEVYSSLVILSATLLVYGYVVGHVIFQRTIYAGVTSSVHTDEIKLLLQSVLIFLSCALLELFWNFGDVLLPASRWSNVAVNAAFILHSGWVNPLLCLICNRYAGIDSVNITL
uniref:7TM_GPCR_Srx domain-containing protein n=1 Tax=Steinernema glaseri TaxID=37863 RepID=A0A1I7Y9D2_9BILA